MVQLFGINKSEQNANENIGIARIQSYLRENNIDADLTYLYTDKEIEHQSANIKTDVKYYAISLFYWYNEFAFELCKYIKSINPNALIFIGGRVVTDAYKVIFNDCQYFDFAVLGHGEATLVYAIKELEKGKDIYDISSTCKHLATINDQNDKEELHEDINVLCLPDRTYIKDHFSTASIITSHGCVGNCTFCSWNKSKGKWNGRKMRDVYNEVIDIYESTGINDFMICDGSFEDPGTLGKARLNELCDYLEGYPVKFSFKYYLRAETFKDVPSDINLLNKMRKNGLATAYIGIEAGNNNDLATYNKKARVDDNIIIIKLLRSADIEAFYGFIMLNPYSTLENLKANYEFLTSQNCQHLFNYVNVLEIYYNTEFYWRMKNENLLTSEYRYNKPHLYVCKEKDVEDIKKFICQYFGEKKEIVRNCADFYSRVEYFNSIKVLHDDIYNNYRQIIEDCYSKISQVLNDYFNILYVLNDIPACISTYSVLCDQLNEEYKKSIVVNNKMIRDVIRREKHYKE